jgi:RHS repeat-associated protein
MTDATGTTTNLYDAAGRLSGIDYPSGASVRYQLDILDRITAITNKASVSSPAYVTRYSYDEIGNITNVIDPFNGVTSLEYDSVGRRTKRTLPNNVVTTWQYDWRDRVTNVSHQIGGSVLASAAYERATDGEPTTVTREDGTYVALSYDAALRLTNEVYYSSGGTAQTTNTYAYDASGTRIHLLSGSQNFTNDVAPGYRVKHVQDANNGSVAEAYDYDNGGRLTNIVRSGGTLKLGYNTADQLTAFTNATAGTWVTYAHDAAGRRTISTNSAGAVRRFLVAPTLSGTLPNTLLIAAADGSLQQGYVYVGNRALLRHDATGATAYYLEDAMGSVIGVAPSGSPNIDNTTRLFYDGFGNSRLTNGPSPSLPSGVAGDFRFQAGWFEFGSGLYNFRAREYDPRTARFTSRDPDPGDFSSPESLAPYAFCNLNPFIYSDPSGENNLVEINVVELIQSTMAVMRQVGVNWAKNQIKSSIFNAFINVASRQLGQLSPEYGALLEALGAANILDAATKLERKILGAVCKVPAVQNTMYIEPSIDAKGDAVHNGLSCHQYAGWRPTVSFFRRGKGRPDFILSETPPTELKKTGAKAIVVGEIKLSGTRFYKNYVKPGKKKKQLDAIANFSSKNVATRTAVFLTVWRGDKAKWRQLAVDLLGQGLRKRVLLVLYSATNK